MADKKISALTAITAPLAGTEVLPIVQSSTTKKVSVIELQAAPVSAGIANSVNYLNASKVPSTVSTFSFDGTNFGVGTANPLTYGQLAVVGSGAPTAFVGGNVNAANVPVGVFKFGSTANSNAFIDYGGQIASYTLGGVDQCDLRFYTSNGSASVERWRINPTGNLVAASAGLGIDFSADGQAAGMTSELLDDYEEGTWTPALTAAGIDGAVYSVQTGQYTKVGNRVMVSCKVTLSALTSGGTNYLRVTGLPFAAAQTATASVYSENLTGGTTGRYIVGTPAGTEINFWDIGPDGNATVLGLSGTRLTATSSFTVSLTYSV